MKLFLKSSFILAVILGLVLTQSPTNPPAQNSGQGTPSGSGVMRGNNAGPPNGPSNLPPEQPGISDKLANITDTRLVQAKNILQYLPPVEQDLIAGKFIFF